MEIGTGHLCKGIQQRFIAVSDEGLIGSKGGQMGTKKSTNDPLLDNLTKAFSSIDGLFGQDPSEASERTNYQVHGKQ